ncbi:hypothetical protein DXG03_007841 [Asterophora parasitica]|uniref:Uncharacterized protein n=1 Tax=Asterophora parasitica TaxID=117018 RepID=A0A9P7GIZ1_9AGAR|nr:hypothetical protein DXG03_007841 [Asterophora parasitica]
MFRTGSPYSPFFTSGLLSAPSSSRDPSPERPLAPRRGSLPTDSLRSPSSSNFYFTKRDPSEFRSFLSLDLAESQSQRSASLNRTVSVSAPIRHLRSSLRLRHSRDSIRTIPSPKPAPSITLPDLPIPSRASSLVITRTPAPAEVVPLPALIPFPTTKRNSTSTVTTSVRRTNRSHALARLEGRTASTRRRRARSNFMSMSDEDDDDEPPPLPLPSTTTLNALHEPEDLVLPPPSPPYTSPLAARFSSSLSPPRKPRKSLSTPNSKDWFPLNSFIDLQPEDDLLSSSPPGLKIDFNLNFALSRWSWRSFVEVANVS